MSILKVFIVCALSAAMYNIVYTQDGETVPNDASPPPTNATVSNAAAQNATCDNIALLAYILRCHCFKFYSFNDDDLLTSKVFVNKIINGTENMCENRISNDPTVYLPTYTKYTVDLCAIIAAQLWFARGYCVSYFNYNVTNSELYGNETLNFVYSYRSLCQPAVFLSSPENYGCPAGAVCP